MMNIFKHQPSTLALGSALLALGLGASLSAQAENPAPAKSPGTYILEGAKVFTGEGGFKDGLFVVIQDGKLQSVSGTAPELAGARRLKLPGRYITPGLIDANTSLGLPSSSENEQSSEVTPQVKAIDAIDPSAPAFRHALRRGVTSAYVSPGGYNVFGGLGVVVKTAGSNLASRIVREDADLRMTLGSQPSAGNRNVRYGTPSSIYYRRPTTRMGVIWEVRNAFYKAMEQRGSGIPGQQVSRKLKVLIQALDKKIKVRTTARQEHDIRSALRLAKEFGIDIVIDGATEAYYVLDYIVAAKIPVVAEPPSVMMNGDRAEAHLDTIALLAKKGVPVAIQTGQGTSSLPLIREACLAVKNGMPRDKALEAITSVPASILGIDKRCGRLKNGLDADVVVWSRHPLSPSSRVEHVFVDGREIQ